MKKIQLVAAAALFAAAASAPALAADVGVSVHISQPGVYGRVDIGRYPQPQLVVQQPVIVERQVVTVRPEPVYMWVPPGHRKNWKKHCREYGACGVPVYFVQDQWYGQHVHDRDDRRDDRHDERDEHDNGKHKDKHKDKKDKKDKD